MIVKTCYVNYLYILVVELRITSLWSHCRALCLCEPQYMLQSTTWPYLDNCKICTWPDEDPVTYMTSQQGVGCRQTSFMFPLDCKPIKTKEVRRVLYCLKMNHFQMIQYFNILCRIYYKCNCLLPFLIDSDSINLV